MVANDVSRQNFPFRVGNSQTRLVKCITKGLCVLQDYYLNLSTAPKSLSYSLSLVGPSWLYQGASPSYETPSSLLAVGLAPLFSTQIVPCFVQSRVIRHFSL
jgi:hypothetical protein